METIQPCITLLYSIFEVNFVDDDCKVDNQEKGVGILQQALKDFDVKKHKCYHENVKICLYLVRTERVGLFELFNMIYVTTRLKKCEDLS